MLVKLHSSSLLINFVQLQFKSNQHLEEEEVDKVGDFALSEPELFDEMATKRAKSYKDPGR